MSKRDLDNKDNPDICSKCGQDMVDESGFCLNCGHSEWGKEDKKRQRTRYAKYRRDTKSRKNINVFRITIGVLLLIFALIIFDIFTVSKGEINKILIEVGTDVTLARYEEAQVKIEGIIYLRNLTPEQKQKAQGYINEMEFIAEEDRLKAEAKRIKKEEEQAIKDAFQDYESNIRVIKNVLGAEETKAIALFEKLKSIGFVKIDHIIDSKGKDIKSKEQVLEDYKSGKYAQNTEIDLLLKRILIGSDSFSESEEKEVLKENTYLVIGKTTKNTINSVIVVMDLSHTVIEIKDEKKIYYTQAEGIKDTLENYILSDSEKSEFLVLSQKFVKEKLERPETAKFSVKNWGNSDWVFTKDNNTVRVKSYVDSDNAHLTKVRQEFTVEIDYTTKALLYMEIEGGG